MKKSKHDCTNERYRFDCRIPWMVSITVHLVMFVIGDHLPENECGAEKFSEENCEQKVRPRGPRIGIS